MAKDKDDHYARARELIRYDLNPANNGPGNNYIDAYKKAGIFSLLQEGLTRELTTTELDTLIEALPQVRVPERKSYETIVTHLDAVRAATPGGQYYTRGEEDLAAAIEKLWKTHGDKIEQIFKQVSSGKLGLAPVHAHKKAQFLATIDDFIRVGKAMNAGSGWNDYQMNLAEQRAMLMEPYKFASMGPSKPSQSKYDTYYNATDRLDAIVAPGDKAFGSVAEDRTMRYFRDALSPLLANLQIAKIAIYESSQNAGRKI